MNQYHQFQREIGNAGDYHNVVSTFPSHKDPCIFVKKESGLYPQGAHTFLFVDSLGWDNENLKTSFLTPDHPNSKGKMIVQQLNFIRKDEEGILYSGVTTEQLLVALLHRHTQLNLAFPSEENEVFLVLIRLALETLAKRVEDRIKRGVMGDLKK